MASRKTNVVFLFADQWRQQATGFAGDPNFHTPHLNKLADESLVFTNAVSGCPVCSPYRASLLTGQRPLTHGVFVNDVPLVPKGPTLGESFAAAGYTTGYIGKWHVNDHGRSAFIPPERRFGFQYWKVLECTHDYNHSLYYEGDSQEKKIWDGYDAIAQTRDAQEFIRKHSKGDPFFLVLSWGPPHEPYHTAPEEFRKRYDSEKLTLRQNVPQHLQPDVRKWLAGYYAHCSALDQCVGDIVKTLYQCGIEENTLLVFTSDHGDMLGSQGESFKQRPWDESIRVPFVLRLPGPFHKRTGTSPLPIDAPDILPTLLGICDIATPQCFEGKDYSPHIKGEKQEFDDAALIMCPHPFGQWTAKHHHGREYRGIRTERFTYVRDLKQPWLLYDNLTDPFQMLNLVDDPHYTKLRQRLDDRLSRLLESIGDEFLPGEHYLKQWGYTVDNTGTVPYTE